MVSACMGYVGSSFNDLKEEFYAVYQNNDQITSNYRKKTLSFLDKFYETINDDEKAWKDLSYPCDKSGTGDIVIKGMRKN